MSTITVGEARSWEGATFIFVWTSKKLDIGHHCAGCDEDFTGDCNIWRDGDRYSEWCNGCHEIVVNSAQEAPNG